MNNRTDLTSIFRCCTNNLYIVHIENRICTAAATELQISAIHFCGVNGMSEFCTYVFTRIGILFEFSRCVSNVDVEGEKFYIHFIAPIELKYDTMDDWNFGAKKNLYTQYHSSNHWTVC